MPPSFDDVVRELNSGDPPLSGNVSVLFRSTLPVDVDAADGDGRSPVIFVPDVHVLSADRAIEYTDYFHLNQSQEDLLTEVLRRLLGMKAIAEFSGLRIYQLGDFHDLWREAAHWWGEDICAMLLRQVRSHRVLFDLFRQLKTERLVGNHDKKLRVPEEIAKLIDEEIADYFPLSWIYPVMHSFRWGATCRIDLIHADVFDSVETGLFHFLNPLGARLAQHDSGINIGEIDEWQHELGPPGHEDSFSSSSLLQGNVRFGDPDVAPGMEKYYQEATEYAADRDNVNPGLGDATCIAIVIGHTHAPRIVLGSASIEERLVDCGSWVNQSSLVRDPSSSFWNAQLGILAGNEIGIVQCGY